MAKQVAPQRYMFTGQQKTLHSFAELGSIATTFTPQNLRRFLPGSFVFEHKGKRTRELMETAGAYACRLNLYEARAEA